MMKTNLIHVLLLAISYIVSYPQEIKGIETLYIPFQEEAVDFEKEGISSQERKELQLTSYTCFGTSCKKFHILRSQIDTFEKQGLCLQEAFNSTRRWKRKKIHVVAAICDGSSSQNWHLDTNGFLHNQRFPKKCLKRDGRWLEIDECSTNDDDKALKWIFSTDGTIRWNAQATFAISIHRKFLNSLRLSKRQLAMLTVGKIVQRSAKINEKWFFEEVVQSLTTTTSPSVQPHQTFNPATNPSKSSSLTPTHRPTIQPLIDVEGNQQTLHPTREDLNEKEFNINLLNMGEDHTYDEAFMKAKAKLEQLIIGDMPNQEASPDPSHDWFGGIWPDNPINMYIDDILIGYEISDIDGIDRTLGFAGPVYVRRTMSNGNQGHKVESMTTISGVMKFDKYDFIRMKISDIYLVILHEMVHVLGLGTLWSEYLCGTKCVVDDEMNESRYECNGANVEYNKSYSNKSNLLISSDCAHWSETSFNGMNSSELMTPYFEENAYQPLSSISIASIGDLGYKVNISAADPLMAASTSANENTKRKRILHTTSGDNIDCSNDSPDISYEGDVAFECMKPSKTFVLDGQTIVRPEMLIYL